MSRRYLETLRCLDGELCNLEYHQERLDGVLSSLNAEIEFPLKTLLTPPQHGLYRCRILYDTRGISVEYHHYKKREIKRLKLLYDDSIIYDKKYEDREELQRAFMQREECDDVLIVQHSLITDTSVANIALYNGKEWLTPKKPLLYGTTRRRLLLSKKILEADIEAKDINSFEQVALMNAMIDFDIISQDNIRNPIC